MNTKGLFGEVSTERQRRQQKQLGKQQVRQREQAEKQPGQQERESPREALPGSLWTLAMVERIHPWTGGLRNGLSLVKDLSTTKFHFPLGLGQDTHEA